jgi:hypothetical protein
MKPNEAHCEENQGVRGQKIPPPFSEFENPGRPPEFSLAQNLVFDTGLDELVFAVSMKRQIQK